MGANAEQQLWIRWTMLNNDTTRRATEDKKEKHLARNFYRGFLQIDAIIAFLSQIISLLSLRLLWLVKDWLWKCILIYKKCF